MTSFVVPAYNEERLLARTIEAIHAAARELRLTYEVIVVDDGSTDRTAAIAEEHGCRVVHVAFRQIARTRNAGARAAAGETLIFVDADTIVSAAVVRASIAALRDGAVGGGADVCFEGRLPAWAVVMLPVLVAAWRAARMAAGCYLFCTRAAFDAIGGFDERLFAAEEVFFSRGLQRLGPVIIVRHAVTTSGRKLRTHSAKDMLRLVGHVMRHGVGAVRDRERLSLWYDGRRDDPEGW